MWAGTNHVPFALAPPPDDQGVVRERVDRLERGPPVAAMLAASLWSAISIRDPTVALEHPRRKRLMEWIRREPGATFRDLMRMAGFGLGVGRHHLEVLKRCGLVDEKALDATSRFFTKDRRLAAHWQAIAVLRDKELALLHQHVAASPGQTQAEIVRRLAKRHGWSRSTVQYRLGRLEEHEVVSVAWEAHRKLYFSTDGARAAATFVANQGSQMVAPPQMLEGTA